MAPAEAHAGSVEMNEISKALFAGMVAVMMMATGIVVCETAPASDATANGTVGVNYYDGSSWNSLSYPAYNVYQAVKKYDVANNNVSFTFASEQWATSGNPTNDYGLITAVDGSSDFSVYVYDDANSVWRQTTYGLGWYRPFEDYASTAKLPDGTTTAGAANVAIVKGSIIPSMTSLTIIDLTEIQENADFRYSFFIKDTTTEVSLANNVPVTIYHPVMGYIPGSLNNTNLHNPGLTIYGYGSDAYLALIDALGVSNVIGQNTIWELHTVYEEDGVTVKYTYYTYYSWMDEVLGAGTESDSGVDPLLGREWTTYWYWASYTAAGSYLSYTFGYYSGLSEGYISETDFKYIYEVSTQFSS
jgi:hypothetical protein